MKLRYVETYKNVSIHQNEDSGNYYLHSPYNGTLRIFKTMEYAKDYVDKYEVIESHAKALKNPWY